MENEKIFFAYTRLSKKELKRNQKGLEVQKDGINNFLKNYYNAKPKKIFEEIKSGKNLERKQLIKILGILKKNKNAYLVVYKIDRLSRDLFDLMKLIREHNYRILIVELNNYQVENKESELYFQIVGAMAQNERQLISERTKSGIKKSRENNNNKWGNSKGINLDKAREVSKEVRRLNALERRKEAIILYNSLKSLKHPRKEIINHFNKFNILTPQGKKYNLKNLELLERLIKEKKIKDIN